jgi:hypothetical protein
LPTGRKGEEVTAVEKEKRKATRFEKRREMLLKIMRKDVTKMRAIIRKKTPTK